MTRKNTKFLLMLQASTMRTLTALFIITAVRSIHAPPDTSLFSALPLTVKSHIYDWLPTQAMLRSVMTLNSDTYRNYYRARHAHISKLKRVLSSLHVSNLGDADMTQFTSDTISNLTSQVMVDELFHLQWPSYSIYSGRSSSASSSRCLGHWHATCCWR